LAHWLHLRPQDMSSMFVEQWVAAMKFIEKAAG
jgi:hypothetical protein